MNARLPAGHIRVLDPFSPEGIREAVAKILEGHNYRLFFEDVTKRRLIATYRNLAEYRMEDETDDEKWKEAIRNELAKGGNKNSGNYSPPLFVIATTRHSRAGGNPVKSTVLKGHVIMYRKR